MSFESEVAQHLANTVIGPPGPAGPGELLGPVDLVYGVNVRTGAEKPADAESATFAGAIPDECVFVLESGGRSFEAWKGGDQDDWTNWPGADNPGIEIVIRSKPFDYDGGKLLADVVAAALDMNPPPGYFYSRATRGRPEFDVEDDQNRFKWSVSFEMRKER